MSTEKAREVLGEIAMSMNDEELQIFINQCKRIASIIVDFAEEEATK